ncbi:hypothetical protein KP509_15G023100 [Ceratopteris richardii]|nr:hypothetical protein KP509_15G023100 [Ceratopteris richardii]
MQFGVELRTRSLTLIMVYVFFVAVWKISPTCLSIAGMPNLSGGSSCRFAKSTTSTLARSATNSSLFYGTCGELIYYGVFGKAEMWLSSITRSPLVLQFTHCTQF